MNIKNYTSEVPAATSMGKIERCLVQTGASDISKKYANGVCTSITFRMAVKGIPVFFMLPARVAACEKVLLEQYVNTPSAASKKKAKEQAERTTWKLIAEWVEVQLSMIRLEQADALQVFLPYVYDPATDKTLYQRVTEGNLKLLTN